MAETFTLSLANFAKAAPEKANIVMRKASQSMLAEVVLRTPVGNPSLWKHKPPPGYVGGRLRGNWNVGIGAPDVSTSVIRDQSGQPTIARESAKLAGADGKVSIFITNSLPYAIPVEFGHSAKQAPAGMVRVTVTQWQAFVEAEAKRVAALPEAK